jgi:hypothetical protein
MHRTWAPILSGAARILGSSVSVPAACEQQPGSNSLHGLGHAQQLNVLTRGHTPICYDMLSGTSHRVRSATSIACILVIINITRACLSAVLLPPVVTHAPFLNLRGC